MIVGIKNFHRIDKVMEMTVKDFLLYLFTMTVDSVKGLAFNIDGKHETVPLTLPCGMIKIALNFQHQQFFLSGLQSQESSQAHSFQQEMSLG